jgi:hypothetical protein
VGDSQVGGHLGRRQSLGDPPEEVGEAAGRASDPVAKHDVVEAYEVDAPAAAGGAGDDERDRDEREEQPAGTAGSASADHAPSDANVPGGPVAL